MTRCIIHIGMHKTGSTSIQNSLRGYSDAGFLYADLGGQPNHSLAIYSMFAHRPEQHHLHQAGKRGAAAVAAYNQTMRQQLDQSIALANGRTLIISGEDISALPQDDLRKLHDYFQTRFDYVDVVAYVRAPGGYMTSSFQQRVKGGGAQRLVPEKEYRNYEKTFGKFDEVFGRENVSLWKFNPGAFHGGCVVKDFCARLHIDLPANRVVRSNESISRLAVSMLYTYRKFGPKDSLPVMKGAEAQAIGALLAPLDSAKFRLSPEDIRPVLEKNRADIEWMEARLGESLYEELGEHQPGDIRSEADLLRPDPKAVAQLLGILGDAVPKGVKGETPEEVAQLVHALRMQKAGVLHEGGARPTVPVGEARLTIQSLLKQAQEEHPEVLGKMPAQQAAALLRTVFGQVSATLAQSGEGAVVVGGLGRFEIKQERAAGGSARRRIWVHPVHTVREGGE